MVPYPQARPEPLCILVVEDEVIIRATTAAALRKAGFVVLEATNAHDALSYFGAGVRIDGVFSDVELPGSLDGLELVRRLRTEHPDLPIVLTSGGRQFELDMLFFPKPYSVAEVVAFFANLAAGRQDSEG
jgi:CheY-like chemotaxis protein